MPMQSMKHQEVRNLESIPVGSLGLVALPGYREMVEKVDEYLIRWRTERENEHKNSLAFAGYIRPSYIVGSEPEARDRSRRRQGAPHHRHHALPL